MALPGITLYDLAFIKSFYMKGNRWSIIFRGRFYRQAPFVAQRMPKRCLRVNVLVDLS
jgi:hypothetical protein